MPTEDPPITASWLSMVLPRKANLGESRPCIFCGDCSKVTRKTITVDSVLKSLDLSENNLKNNSIWRTMENVCLSAIAIQKKHKVDEFSETVACCLSCSHWAAKKKGVYATPLVQFKWHIRTMSLLGKKRFDKRSIHRLATVLSQPNNFYRTLFTPQELKCMQKMKDVRAKDVNCHIRKLFERQNNWSLFVEDSNVAELLRD
tara:strand:+ start:1293 stop:1898 length:606 start_codon:yes stop_codon:yes gene_type:complete